MDAWEEISFCGTLSVGYFWHSLLGQNRQKGKISFEAQRSRHTLSGDWTITLHDQWFVLNLFLNLDETLISFRVQCWLFFRTGWQRPQPLLLVRLVCGTRFDLWAGVDQFKFGKLGKLQDQQECWKLTRRNKRGFWRRKKSSTYTAGFEHATSVLFFVLLPFFFFQHEWGFLRQDPFEAILVIFGCRALISFCLKALGKIWKMTPLLCACAVVIALEMKKCRKRTPRSVELNFFINCDRHKRFSQNERRLADLQNHDSDFLIFA